MEGGRIPLKKMIASVSSAVIGADGELTDIMKHAANEARDVLARTGDRDFRIPCWTERPLPK